MASRNSAILRRRKKRDTGLPAGNSETEAGPTGSGAYSVATRPPRSPQLETRDRGGKSVRASEPDRRRKGGTVRWPGRARGRQRLHRVTGSAGSGSLHRPPHSGMRECRFASWPPVVRGHGQTGCTLTFVEWTSALQLLMILLQETKVDRIHPYVLGKSFPPFCSFLQVPLYMCECECEYFVLFIFPALYTRKQAVL
jgi:hypothetical protein